jgi:hypothetical protein
MPLGIVVPCRPGPGKCAIGKESQMKEYESQMKEYRKKNTYILAASQAVGQEI